MSELQDMLIKQLRDAFSAEKQAIQGMKRALRIISDGELRTGTQAHIDQSEEQRERVQEALQHLKSKPDRTVCEAMRGLVEEAQHEMEGLKKGPVTDLTIIASMQRIEHYEIAAYGTMTELAKALRQDEVAELLHQTLSEEKAQDERLTDVTRTSIMPLALEADSGMAAAQDEEGDDDGDEGEKEGVEASLKSAKPAKPKPATASKR